MLPEEIKNEFGSVWNVEIVSEVLSGMQSTKKHLLSARFNDKTKLLGTIQALAQSCKPAFLPDRWL